MDGMTSLPAADAADQHSWDAAVRLRVAELWAPRAPTDVNEETGGNGRQKEVENCEQLPDENVHCKHVLEIIRWFIRWFISN